MNAEDLNPAEKIVPTVPVTGRLGIYTQHADEIDLLLLRCGAAGYSFAQMAACIGVATRTLKEWAGASERCASVLERSKTLSQAWWEGRAMDGTANNLIGSTVWAKSMAARFREDYTERHEHVSPDGSMSPNKPLTAVEVAEELAKRGIPVPDID